MAALLTSESSVRYLKNVGEKRAQAYKKIGVNTLGDLLFHFPRDYIDLLHPVPIAEAPLHEIATVRAVLTYKSGEQRIRKGLSIFRLTVADSSDSMDITIFNAAYLVKGLVLDKEYIFLGRIDGNLLRKKMTAPQIFSPTHDHSILPIYPQTLGISSHLIRKNVKQILEECAPLVDPLPEHLRTENNLGERNACFREIHFPTSFESAHLARERFVFEELLTLGCAFARLRNEKLQKNSPPMKSQDLSAFYHALPFALTGAQNRCVQEALDDLMSGKNMNRLLQGDVGSGKTAVAAACIYFTFLNGGQSALMVPTEILAEQHFLTMQALLSPLGVTIALLTGSTKTAEKRELLNRLADGSLSLCVGTHALLTDGNDFLQLQLVITDEQHRFGVAQRAKLSAKSEEAHVLVMSATPIPRTLSLLIYGDLSLSILDELPPGRIPIDTLLIDSSKRARALGFVRKHTSEGRQAYIVCSLIETGENSDGLLPATQYAEHLAANELRGIAVGLLHGRMKSREKEQVMRDFHGGKIQVLVSTTVVEVGVDVPNATIMFVENAERFGLSQLHQLRGRVGRGMHKSWCILLSDSKGEVATQRLSAMQEVSDGFRLAEIDLKQRGPGDFFGLRQHGLPTLRVASLSNNMDTMLKAQGCAEKVLAGDPLLSLPEHQELKTLVDVMLRAVGGRPN